MRAGDELAGPLVGHEPHQPAPMLPGIVLQALGFSRGHARSASPRSFRFPAIPTTTGALEEAAPAQPGHGGGTGRTPSRLAIPLQLVGGRFSLKAIRLTG